MHVLQRVTTYFQGGPGLAAMRFGLNQSRPLLATELHINPSFMMLPVIKAGQDLDMWPSTKLAGN